LRAEKRRVLPGMLGRGFAAFLFIFEQTCEKYKEKNESPKD
jgi:hypothetical protein